MGTTTRRRGTIGLPPQGDGLGDWYQLNGPASHRCAECGHTYTEHVAVLEYLPAVDDGFQNEEHPGWAVLGWLAQWDCPQCGAMTLEVVDTPTVARWGRPLGTPAGRLVWPGGGHVDASAPAPAAAH